VLEDVGDTELPALYRHALVFAYPSFAEGFGMPPLEAMASGVPVLTAASTAIPEVVGDAGLLVDPNDAAALREALARLLSDAALRTQLVERGLARAAEFTWRRSAEVLAAAYRHYFQKV
jgi:glycosyltransferase involved in cell wall biosynthesis